MGLQKLKDYHKEMAMCEALLGYKRADLQKKFSEHLSSIDAVNRIMNDPLIVEYKDYLIKEKEERILSNVVNAEKVVIDNLENSANIVASIMNDKSINPHIRLKAAIDNLNRGGVRVEEDTVKKTPSLVVEYNSGKEKKNAVQSSG